MRDDFFEFFYWNANVTAKIVNFYAWPWLYIRPRCCIPASGTAYLPLLLKKFLCQILHTHASYWIPTLAHENVPQPILHTPASCLLLHVCIGYCIPAAATTHSLCRVISRLFKIGLKYFKVRVAEMASLKRVMLLNCYFQKRSEIRISNFDKA